MASRQRASTTTSFPFGVWFADAKTLYVADEGNGTNTYDPRQKYIHGGRQADHGWTAKVGVQHLALDTGICPQAGLNLGVPYTVTGYPTGNNSVTSLPWSPATDGLRNITGRVNGDGTVTIWGVTSTVSGNGDQGADPNKLVMITDNLAATTLPQEKASRWFERRASAKSSVVFRSRRAPWRPAC